MKRTTYLRWALIGNAMVAFLLGTSLMFYPAAYAAWLGYGSWIPGIAVGVVLTVYGVIVLREASLRRLSRRHARVAGVVDFVFAALMLTLVIKAPEALNLAGNLSAMGLSVVMVIFGLAQWNGAEELSEETP